MNIFDQHEFDIRLEWGEKGVEVLAPISDVVIIVDVLSFSTCVDIAVSRGATVYPYRHRDDTARSFADQNDALLAGSRSDTLSSYSLSPASLLSLPAQSRLVLPSPNGAKLSLSTGQVHTICGCLRNAKAIADYAMHSGRKIAVIPAGERWEDGSIRFAIEDMIGAGAIISYLSGTLSPDSRIALAAFQSCGNLYSLLSQSSSGLELIALGNTDDVRIASEYNVSDHVPLLAEGRYQAVKFQ